ncbi:hypothetical protein D3C81_1746570 [compost metagenome]
MRVAQRQAEVLALHRSTVTHADQLQLALEAFGNTLDHVGQDGADGTGQRDQVHVVGAQGGNAVFDIDVDTSRLGQRQGALRALGDDVVVLDVQFNLTQVDRLLGYTGHGLLLSP